VRNLDASAYYLEVDESEIEQHLHNAFRERTGHKLLSYHSQQELQLDLSVI